MAAAEVGAKAKVEVDEEQYPYLADALKNGAEPQGHERNDF